MNTHVSYYQELTHQSVIKQQKTNNSYLKLHFI